MFNIKVGYPTAEEEEEILTSTSKGERQEVRKVLSAKAIVNLQKLVHSVAVSEFIVKYVAALVRATRPKDPSAPEFVRELVDWGAGPRAGMFLIASPHQHEFSGAGRRDDERRRDPAVIGHDSRAQHSQV